MCQGHARHIAHTLLHTHCQQPLEMGVTVHWTGQKTEPQRDGWMEGLAQVCWLREREYSFAMVLLRLPAQATRTRGRAFSGLQWPALMPGPQEC